MLCSSSSPTAAITSPSLCYTGEHRKVPALSPVLCPSQLKYIRFVSSSSKHTSCVLPPVLHLTMPSIMSFFFHAFMVFIPSASLLTFAPCSPPSSPSKTPIMSNWLYFQIKLGCEGAGECCPGDWLSPGCCPAVPHPCLKRSSPFPALPFTFCVHCKGTKPRRGMGQVLLPQPGIPSLAPAGLHPTAGSS